MKKGIALLVIAILPIYLLAQQTVSGIVTGADSGSPLSGVSVTIQQTTIGTTTNQDGYYELTVPDREQVLEFSFVGMITQTIEVSSRVRIDVTLQKDTLSIDGIVVTAIGLPREIKTLGYSVQKLTAEEINVVPQTNITNSLTGKVAGVQVTSTSGSPGAMSYITIRGSASIDGNNEPLFVVDGVPVSNDTPYESGARGAELSSRITDINPEDIESISVLKGGAATALYGIMAANGAILLTTKKGVKTDGKKVNVSLSTSVTFDQVSQLPELQTKYGQGLDGSWISGDLNSWGPRLDTCSYSRDPDVWGYPQYDVDGAIVSARNERATGEPVNVYDHYSFFNSAVSTNNTLSFSGGSDKGLYYNSISYSYINGVVPNSNWKRFNVKVGGEANLSESFRILGSITYMKTGGDRMPKGFNSSGVMLGILLTPPSFDNGAGYALPDGKQRNFQHGYGIIDNPYWSVNKNLFKDDVNRIIGYTGFNWYVNKWLQVYYKLGGDYYNIHHDNHYAIDSREYPGGAVYIYNLYRLDINSDLILQATHRFNDQFELSLKLGHNLYQRSDNGMDATGLRLGLPGFYDISNASEVNADQWSGKLRRAGIYGQLETSWKNMVYLTLTGRNDWSTTLPATNNSFFYPSASLGWVFTQLSPLKGNRILPFGKIRFSLAQIANDPDWYKTNTGYDQTVVSDRYSIGLYFPFMDQPGFTLSNNLGNEELEPERTTSWEVGTDLRFFNNRIGIDFTYFNNFSDGLLMPVGLSGASGYYSIEMNAASMSSKGVEAVIYGKPLESPDWNWDFTLNFTKIKNIVEKIPEELEYFGIGWSDPWVVARAGYPYQSFFGYDWYRDEYGNVLIDDAPESDTYGFPVGINTDTVVYLGKVTPDWVLGWTNNIHWKNMSLTFLLEFKRGGDVSNETRGFLYDYGAHKDTEGREPEDTYVFEGVKATDGSENDIPVIRDADWFYNGQGGTYYGQYSSYIEDASWIRLREIALTYRFSKETLGNGFLKGLDVYFAGKNLLLITEYSGIDPETNLLGKGNAQGIDLGNMPGIRSYTVGLRASF